MVIENENRFGSGESPQDLAALQAAVETWQETVNAAPDAEMGGLSPNTVHRLLHEAWDGARAIIRFRTDLSPEDLAGARFFGRARRLLVRIHDAGGVRATPKGNLTRAVVAELLADQEMAASESHAALLGQVVNEEDFFPLHVAKLVCRCAGLLLLKKEKFTVTSLGSRLLGEGNTGPLYARLFTACFRKFNLAYAYRPYLDAPSLQQCAGYTLYRLGAVAHDWSSPESLYPKVFLPAVRAQLETELAGKKWVLPAESASGRIFTPLIDFGLLEDRHEKRRGLEHLMAVRTTPLFTKFFAFDKEAPK